MCLAVIEGTILKMNDNFEGEMFLKSANYFK